MSISSRQINEVTINVKGNLQTARFTIKMHAELDVHDSMWTLAQGKYAYGVLVGGVMIPADSLAAAKSIAAKMMALVNNVALEARRTE